MRRTLAALVLCLALSGCATIQPIAQSKETFVACQVADAATTSVLLGRGGFVEANPIMAALIKHGWIPFVAFKVALVWIVYRFDASPPVQTVFNAVACLPLIHNVPHL